MDKFHFRSFFLQISSVIIIGFGIVAVNNCFAADELKMAQKKFPKANIAVDKRTAIPSKITGLKYIPKQMAEIGAPITDKKVDVLAKSFLDENKEILRVDSANLKLISKIMRKGRWYVKYQQTYKGIPIIDATVGMSSSEKGEILSYDASYHPDVSVNTDEVVSKDQAISIAKSSYKKEIAGALKIRSIEKVIWVKNGRGELTYYLAWRVDVVADRDRVENDKIFIIDGKSGKTLQQTPSRFYGAKAVGTLNLTVYPVNPTAPPMATVHAPYAKTDANGFLWSGSSNTNVDGQWNINASSWWTLFSKQYSATFQLNGPYAHVTDTAGNEYVETSNCTVDVNCNHTWTAADPDHLNVFYHINVLHDWYKSHIGYSWVNAWDNSTRFNAEVNGNFNNAYAGDPMSFGNDNYARSSDVIYHECTHNVLYKLYGDWVGYPNVNDESYAFDEGFADFFASAITEDPNHGEGYGGTRTLDNNNQYSTKATYNTEGHTGGTIIAGAAWDLRESLQNSLGDVQGADVADNLIFDALLKMSTLPRDYYFSDPQESNFLSSLYFADDNNNNLMDGVPHFFAIQNAFYQHNLLQAELHNQDSYDVSINSLGNVVGGDFYFYDEALWSNNVGQRGVKDLGNIGNVALDQVNIPSSGYTRQRVNVVLNHTYVSLAQAGEEGGYIVFRVMAFDAANDKVVIQYLYRRPLVIGPIKLCDKYPMLCDKFLICKKNPFLCMDTVVFPYDKGLEFEFRDKLDNVLVPINKICQYVLNCPGCDGSSYCAGYNLVFEGMPQPFGLSVVDSNGKVVVENIKDSTTKRLSFTTARGLQYYLVITPAKGSEVGTRYQLPMSIDTRRVLRVIK